MTSSKSRINQGISFEPAILPKAKKRAESRRQSFSAYVCSLIAADLGCEIPATKDSAAPLPAPSEHPGHPNAA